MSARGGTGLIGGYAPILQRIGKKGDYLGRGPENDFDAAEFIAWIDKRWTLVTSVIAAPLGGLKASQRGQQVVLDGI